MFGITPCKARNPDAQHRLFMLVQ